MALSNHRLRVNRMGTFPHPGFPGELWMRIAAPLNHRFDKVGNPLPMELHGCGCGLCARQHRALLSFWEAE